VDLVALLESIRQVVAPLAQQRGIHFVLNYPATLPTVEGDAAVLHQIIVNLLAEAFGAGGVEVLRLDVCATPKHGISGRLTGLSRDTVVRDLLKRPAIAVSRGLLEVYGGQLVVEIQQDGVAALLFLLPCERPRTLLVIDDHEDTLRLYQRYLQRHGYALRLARNGDEAWQALTEESLPSLIILDVLMPREDGWMILQRLKIMPEMAKIPVIIYSVLSQPSLALALGAVAVLNKPVQEDVLLQALEKYLPRKAAA
jgi:CheY-like chemotaxis protein